jgi:hypothetical protein
VNNSLLNNQWVIEKIREEIIKFANANENTASRTFGMQQKQQ